jgi:hypothetical protein
MNSYIIRPLAQIKKKLSSKETLSPDTIDSIIGELEMIKLNIEQHITNMPENREQNNILSAAHNAVQNLTEILDLFEELANAEQQNEIVDEILVLLDEIIY